MFFVCVHDLGIWLSQGWTWCTSRAGIIRLSTAPQKKPKKKEEILIYYLFGDLLDVILLVLFNKRISIFYVLIV